MIVFCLYGDKLRDEAAMMVATCKWHGYDVLQLSDESTEEVPGVNGVMRGRMDCPQVTFRYRMLQRVEPPYISLDVDILVCRDISGMIDRAYDVSMTRRENKDGMIYNGGVFSVHRRGFIEECVEILEGMPPELQDWTGGQLAMAALGQSGRYKINELPCEEWNYSPHSEKPVFGKQRIYHFKGEKRKKLMRKAYELLRSRR